MSLIPRRRRVRLVMGKQSIGKTLYPSEEDFIPQANAVMTQLAELLTGVCKQVGNVTEDIIVEAIEPTFEKSKVYCPKDTHALVNSAYMEVRKWRWNPIVEIGYARGGNPFYAMYVHENLEMWHKPPTRAKFLQAAIEEDLPEIRARLLAAYNSFMGIS